MISRLGFSAKAMNLPICVLALVAIWADAGGKQPEPGRSPSFKIAAMESSPTLIIKDGGRTFTLKGVFHSEIPSEKWSPEALYQPESRRIIVPMADLSYHLYVLGPEGLELSSIIEGGVCCSQRGTYFRKRDLWHFTQWDSPDTLILYASIDTDSDKDSVIKVRVNVEDDTFTYIYNRREDAISLRSLDESRRLEVHFREAPANQPKQ